MQTDEFPGIFRRQHSTPYFSFPGILPVDELSFEPLTPDNFEQFYLLFEGDTSPFVDNRFKTYEGAKAYATDLSVYGAYSPKCGGQDWLFLANGHYTGILHLYNLSLETFAENHKRAWIGFATKERFRRQSLTGKAVRHFINTIFSFYPQIDFIHAVIQNENTASGNFLLKCGFAKESSERISAAYSYFILHRHGSTLSAEQ